MRHSSSRSSPRSHSTSMYARSDVYREGITKLGDARLPVRRELGYAIKLLAIGREGRETPCSCACIRRSFSHDELLASVDGVLNAVEIEGDLMTAGPVPGSGSGIAADDVGGRGGRPGRGGEHQQPRVLAVFLAPRDGLARDADSRRADAILSAHRRRGPAGRAVAQIAGVLSERAHQHRVSDPEGRRER